MRTVYLGTSEFAATVLERLSASPHRPALVLTRPDRPRGRGRRLASPPVAEAARRLGLELDQPEDVGSEAARARIAEQAPEAVCVCAFGALIKEPLLSAHLMLNVHPSLLPRWRGAAPIERAIMAGDPQTGVSIMRVTAGLDSGPVYAQEAEPIEPADTYGSLAPRLAELGARLLIETLGALPEAVAQDEERVTYAEKITPADRELRPERPAGELERTVRALSPHIGAYLDAAPVGRLAVLEARTVPEVRPAAAGTAATPAPAGTAATPAPGGTAATPVAPLAPGVVSLEGARPVLGTADGGLELLRVQPPGGRPMSGEDYLRGHRHRR